MMSEVVRVFMRGFWLGWILVESFLRNRESRVGIYEKGGFLLKFSTNYVALTSSSVC